MKKYFEPEIEIINLQNKCVIMASGELEPGESIWYDETPLIPFN